MFEVFDREIGKRLVMVPRQNERMTYKERTDIEERHHVVVFVYETGCLGTRDDPAEETRVHHVEGE